MENGVSGDPVHGATGILGQLLKYTQQIAASENDPGVDVAALCEACSQRIEDLKRILPRALEELDSGRDPSGGRSDEKSRILEAIKELNDRTRLCVDILERGRNRAAAEMGRLTRSRRAIRAYSA